MEERLQKLLAKAGIASRRGAEELIRAGRIAINGTTSTELGVKADPDHDHITCDGTPILAEQKMYVLLNKPSGYVTTMSDPQGRPTVAELVPAAEHPGLFPIGRLDFDTTGLLLFSTDGELGNGLLHPRHHVEKRYLALVNGKPTPEQLGQMLVDLAVAGLEARGIDLQDAYKKWGAEIIRLWVASSDYSGDIAGDDKIMARVIDAYRRIRNTLRFLLSNLSGFNPQTDLLPAEQMLDLAAMKDLVSKKW